MDNPKSSFRGKIGRRGNISYVGRSSENKGFTLLVVAGQEFFVRNNDPGLKNLRVTSGSKRIFMVTEEIVAGSAQRICAIYLGREEEVRFVLDVQEHIRRETLTDEILLDERPDYFYKTEV